MPKYIDAEKIVIRTPYGYNNDGDVLIPIAAVHQSIARTPIENVAPRAETVKEFAERLKKELSAIVVIRDIHDEEETDMDSSEVWSKIDELVKEFST